MASQTHPNSVVQSGIAPIEPSANPVVIDQLELKRKIESLGDWFHNLDLHGVPTAPDHFLGDFPNVKWKHIAHGDSRGPDRRHVSSTSVAMAVFTPSR